MERTAPAALVASPDSGFCDKVGAAAELAGIQLVARVAGCHRLPVLLDALQPDILVFDADAPGVEPNRVLASIRRSSPATAILMATGALTDKCVEDALLQGVSGFVTKSCERREYADAMLAIRRGEIWLGREKLAHALTTLLDTIKLKLPVHAREGAEKLSPREEEIVQLISRGGTNKEIAKVLGLSDKTVKAHLSHIFAKLGVTRRSQLAQAGTLSGASAPN